MDMSEFVAVAGERPLDRIVTDGGFCSIFRTIACVGDSLSSGEFESVDEDGKVHYHDMYEYSWGQYIARMAGCKVYNFSCGGMRAKTYVDTFADANGFWDPDKAAQAYIIALGVNDLLSIYLDPIGGPEDFDREENSGTFSWYYSTIIKRYKAIKPDAKFFLMTMPRDLRGGEIKEKGDAHRELLYQMAQHFSNCYVLDLREYSPVHDEEFCKNFYLGGHLSPCGYIYTAKIVASYIDYIIRHNMQDFKRVGFI